MNDKIIINTISRIYLIMTSLLLFIFISLSVLFIVLQNGLYLEGVSVPNIKIRQLYIKWNENLDISIKEVEIIKNKNSSKLELDEISKILKKIPHLYNIIEKISIDKIIVNDVTGSFAYDRGGNGYFSISSPKISLKSSLYFESNLLNFKIDEFEDIKRDIKIHGNIILNTDTKDATSSLYLDIHNDISLNVLAYANKDKLYYKVNSLKDIQDITYAMELLNLHSEVKYWAYEAIDFSSLKVNDIHGWIDLKDLNNAYKNIYASATGDDLTYVYNKNLDSIHTKKTDLIFKNGILNIYPRDAHTYKSKLGKSWLKIDFTKKEELLTLKLLFDGKLDKDTLGILKEYKIKVPFLQNSGVTKTDLTLDVNLRTIAVNAKGDFFAKKANFNYLGYDIDVFDVYVKLNNYDVSIKNMLAKYQDIATTNVDVIFNASDGKGDIDFNIKKIDIKNIDLSLNTKNTPLKVRYTIDPNSDNISIENSSWNIKNHEIKVGKIDTPFNLDKLILKLPQTTIESKTIAKGYIYGNIDLNSSKADLDIILQNIYFGDIKLNKKRTPIKLIYDKKLTLDTNKQIDFTLNSKKSFLNRTIIELENNKISLQDTYIKIGDILKTKLSAEYLLDKKKGYILSRRTRVSTKELGLLYFNKNKTRFDIDLSKKGELKINSKDAEIAYINTKDMWQLDFNSLALLSIDSKFLKKYHFNDGSASFTKNKNDKYINIYAQTTYPYKVMVKDNIELDRYSIKGKIDTKEGTLSATINDDVLIKMDKDIDISANNIGINLNAITDIVNSLENNSEDSNSINVSINAKDSYLYVSEGRHVISDSMYLYYTDHVLTAGLLYKDGVSGLRYEDGKFDAYGENFNDKFMQNLFALSKFKGGRLEFNLSGTAKKYDGVFTINDTIILDYKVLNNVLAFVNTIPALVTFSLPGYNSEGLALVHAYMKFTSNNNVFDISDIYFHSQELDILGNGTADFRKNKIDVELNLKTDIGSKASQIPVVGYLLLDGESLSSTLSVTGALDNPDVSTAIAKEMAVAPLNLLLRTLTLPYYLIKGSDEEDNKK